MCQSISYGKANGVSTIQIEGWKEGQGHTAHLYTMLHGNENSQPSCERITCTDYQRKF